MGPIFDLFFHNTVIFVHGFAIFNLALIFGPISGGHFNPAVTLALMINKATRLPVVTFVAYLVSQFLGGIVAGGLNYGLFTSHYHDSELNTTENKYPSPLGNYGETMTNQNFTTLFFLEMIGTAMLCLAVLMSGNKRNSFISENNSFFGALVIAGMITYTGFAGILQFAGINPAREFGPRVFAALVYGGGVFTSYTWIPIVAPFVGSVLANVLFMLIDKMYE